MNSDDDAHNNIKPSLARRVIHAGGWTTLGFGISQLLRFGGNLILTRLLFPEAFGLMAIVQAVITGVTMLSDVGIAQSIVHNKRGNEAVFVNTAWTVQIVRGFLMWVASWLIAAPIASLYGEPLLAQLLPVVGLTAVIGGFASTKIASAERNLGLAKITMLDIGSSALGLTVTIISAWFDRSVWSLVIGNIVAVTVRVIASHAYLDGISNRFAWQPESLKSMLTFGRWIFVSSALTFLVGEGNRLLIGNLLDVRLLAFFTLAMAIDQFPRQIVINLDSKVLFPAFAEIVRERPERLHAISASIRLAQIAPHWLICVLLVYFGADLMTLLYDKRYHDSAWMLHLLAIGSLVGSVWVSYSAVLWGKGLIKTSSILLATQLFVQIAAMIIGEKLGGARGLILGIAATSWIMYPAYAFVFSRLSLWHPKIDLPFICISVLIAASQLNIPGSFG